MAAAHIPESLAYVLIVAVYGAVIAAVIVIIRRLSHLTDWSLADALSEEVDFTYSSGAKETRLVASTSRVIAVFGLAALLAMFMGIGAVVIHDYAVNGMVPPLDDVLKYLLAGSGLFIPYTINQVRSAFDFLRR